MFKISFLDQEEQIIKSELLTFISEVTEEQLSVLSEDIFNFNNDNVMPIK